MLCVIGRRIKENRIEIKEHKVANSFNSKHL